MRQQTERGPQRPASRRLSQGAGTALGIGTVERGFHGSNEGRRRGGARPFLGRSQNRSGRETEKHFRRPPVSGKFSVSCISVTHVARRRLESRGVLQPPSPFSL